VDRGQARKRNHRVQHHAERVRRLRDAGERAREGRGELGHGAAVEREDAVQAKAKRKIAEQLEKDAKASGDFAKYVLCGKTYLDIFNSNPEAPKSDEILYNAGVCFEDGRSLSTAIEAYTELRSRFPKSNQAAKALARLGGVYGRVAYYDRAAACSRSTPRSTPPRRTPTT
jgi:tetratricopeptide (TPR) repeat protein